MSRSTSLPRRATGIARDARRSRARGLVLAALFTLGSCRRAQRESPPVEPPLPAATVVLEPALAGLIETTAGEVRARPQDPEVWIRLGLVYSAAQMSALAGKSLDQALKLRPEDPRASYLRGVVRLELGETDRAIEDLERVVAAPEPYLPAEWRLGLIHLEANQLEHAERVFRRTFDRHPDSPFGWLGLARVHLARGENEQAATLLEQYLSSKRRNNAGYALRLLGTAYQRLNRPGPARVALARAGGAGMELSDPWFDERRLFIRSFAGRLGEAQRLLNSRNPVAARALLEELKLERPTEVIILANLCSAFVIEGRYDDAIEQCRLAIELQPGAFGSELNLSTALLEKVRTAQTGTSLDLAMQALQHVDRALELNPSLTRAMAHKAAILAAMGQLKEAIVMYRKASGTSEPSVEWLFEAAKLEWRMGLPESIDSLNEVIALEPLHPSAHHLLGVACLRLGRLDDARTALARAAQLSPGDAEVMAALEELHRKQGSAPHTSER